MSHDASLIEIDRTGRAGLGDEARLLADFEPGRFVSLADKQAPMRLKAAAHATRLNDRRVNIRPSEAP